MPLLEAVGDLVRAEIEVLAHTNLKAFSLGQPVFAGTNKRDVSG